MKIVVLMENKAINEKLKSAHGLSMYIEHKNHKILFDVGPNNDLIKNAKILGVDLTKVDTVVISHGHYDHGRGLKKFMQINSLATIFVSEDIFNKHYKKIGLVRIQIGLKKPQKLDRFVFINKNTNLTDDIKIYSKIENVKKVIGDSSLYAKINHEIVIDDFNHEIYMVIKNEKNNVLFSGCSHKGIENIINEIEKQDKQSITHVLGGFHMSHYDPQDLIQTTYLKNLGQRFYNKKTQTYYSCHCTGDNAFAALKPQMKEKLERIKTGSIINL